MFVQMLLGHAPDAAAVRAALDHWVSDVVPGADGYLGSTTGITDDRELFSIARYESAEAAHANGSRAEFQQWWADTSRRLGGPPTVRESHDVFTDLVGDPNQAGFVQVMLGGTSNPDRARELLVRNLRRLNALRPDIVGRLVAELDGSDYLQVVYFTSEGAAREGESRMAAPPPELMADLAEMQTLTRPPDYFDLKDPWLTSP